VSWINGLREIWENIAQWHHHYSDPTFSRTTRLTKHDHRWRRLARRAAQIVEQSRISPNRGSQFVN
jgi:hypothetical protein